MGEAEGGGKRDATIQHYFSTCQQLANNYKTSGIEPKAIPSATEVATERNASCRTL
jgi:hypothetical protein